jgi:NAD(P)-dependent dehydrogenase (short-subunit alcohol dehydrogenase family)
MSKHALRSVSQSLQMELAPGIAVAELIPGEVDTAMQADLRRPDPGGFAMAEFFRDNRANLIPVALAARFCLWVLTQTSQRQLTDGSPCLRLRPLTVLPDASESFLAVPLFRLWWWPNYPMSSSRNSPAASM